MPDKDGFVSDEEIQVTRNEDGEVQPQTVKTSIGKMRMTPISYGVAEEFQNTLEAGGEADTEEVYKLLKNNVDKPEFEVYFHPLMASGQYQGWRASRYATEIDEDKWYQRKR